MKAGRRGSRRRGAPPPPPFPPGPPPGPPPRVPPPPPACRPTRGARSGSSGESSASPSASSSSPPIWRTCRHEYDEGGPAPAPPHGATRNLRLPLGGAQFPAPRNGGLRPRLVPVRPLRHRQRAAKRPGPPERSPARRDPARALSDHRRFPEYQGDQPGTVPLYRHHRGGPESPHDRRGDGAGGGGFGGPVHSIPPRPRGPWRRDHRTGHRPLPVPPHESRRISDQIIRQNPPIPPLSKGGHKRQGNPTPLYKKGGRGGIFQSRSVEVFPSSGVRFGWEGVQWSGLDCDARKALFWPPEHNRRGSHRPGPRKDRLLRRLPSRKASGPATVRHRGPACCRGFLRLP